MSNSISHTTGKSTEAKSIRWKDVRADWHEVKLEIDTAPHGMKSKIKKDIAARYGLSLDQLHSAIRSKFGKAKTVKRSDQEESEEYKRNRRVAYLVAEHKEKMKMQGSGERELSTWRVLEILTEWGVAEAAFCCESTINRILREELGYRQKTPRKRLECTHALQEVQVDYSFSKYFRPAGIDPITGDYILKATGKTLEYKENEKRMRVMLGGITDSYSRVRYHAGLISAGESGISTVAFLNDFFNRPEDELVFRHVGWLWRMDNGPLAKSQEGKSFFKAINRPISTSVPYEKTGIGKAERGWQMIWQTEMELASEVGEGGLICLADYNAKLLAECVRQQYQEHPFYVGKRKIDLYQQSILRQDPRPETIDADVTKMVYTFLRRKVGTDQLIRINNAFYEVPVWADERHYTTDQWVRVMINKDGSMKGELIDQNAPKFEIRQYVPTQTGSFSGTHAKTFAQRLADDVKDKTTITEQLRKRAPEHTEQQKPMRPRPLMPQPKVLTPVSPFAEDAAEITPSEATGTCSSKFEAMTLVAQLLRRHGLDLNDELFSYFDELVLEVALDKFSIQKAVSVLVAEINNTNTGTEG